MTIRGEEGSTILKVNEGEKINLSFIHSVELFRWTEIYQVEDEELILIESLTKSCGWGLPSVGKNFSFKEVGGETWMAFEMRRPLKSLLISTAPINDYTLTLNRRVIKLGKFGKLVEIRVKKLNLLKFLLLKWKSKIKQPKPAL